MCVMSFLPVTHSQITVCLDVGNAQRLRFVRVCMVLLTDEVMKFSTNPHA